MNRKYLFSLAVLASTALTGCGASGTGAATASLLVDPIIGFAPGFDSTGYSIVVSPGVGNGAAADAPEPAGWLLIAPAMILFLIRTRGVKNVKP